MLKRRCNREKPALNWIGRSGNFLNIWEIVKHGVDGDNFLAWEL